MPIYHKVDARSREWFLMRLCIPTASEFHKIVSPGGKLSKQSEGYAHTLLAEAMLGHELDSPETAWMTRGTELEDAAIASYEFEAGAETSPGGFITNDEGTYGCSPDRLVGDDGDLEIKCPAPNTHIGYLLSPESLCADKRPQVQGRLLIHGRKWVDLMSYHPEMPSVIVRIERDKDYIAKLSTALDEFVSNLRVMRESLVAKYGPFPEITLEAPPRNSEFDVTDEDVDEMILTGAVSFPST